MPYRDSESKGGKIRIKNSATAGEAKPALVGGELALNSADGVLYHRDGQFPSATGFKRIVSLTQSAYDALTPAADTLYVVTPDPS
jgi:hypothetical protein